MVFTHACVAHQSFQEAKLIKERKSLRKNVFTNSTLVNIAYQGQKNVPDWVIHNRLNIVEIKAEGNFFNENVFNMPVFPKLKTLSISNNRVRNIGTLITHLKRTCPNLQVLNLDGNPGWPTEQQEVHKYRKIVASHLKSLQVLNEKDTYRRRERSTLSATSSTDSDMTDNSF